MSQKKIALINDFTGFGRCAITVQLPVISKLKVQCCVIPTAILSNHSAYPSWFLDDFSDRMDKYTNEWKKIGIKFDGITTGFLCSRSQIEGVIEFIDEFKGKDTVVVVDPVMGDNGKIYGSFNKEMCEFMKMLVKKADVVTPNITESCILTGVEYTDSFTPKDIAELALRLSAMGPEKVVITGIETDKYIGNYCYEKNGFKGLVKVKKTAGKRCGTGDIFSGVVSAKLVNGASLRDSVKTAGKFIKMCMEESEKLEVPKTEGVAFEEVLDKLR